MKPHLKLKHLASEWMPRASAAANVALPFYSTSHDAASLTSRDMRAWRPGSLSPDADLLLDLDTIRSRARDIDRNNGIAKGGIQTIVDNVVGTGLRLSARPDYAALGQTKDWAVTWAAQMEGLFHGWWWTTDCHAGDTMTGDQMSAQAVRGQLLNGDALTLPLWLPGRGTYATKLQMVEGDRLSNPYFQLDQMKVRGGIEFDDYGAPIAYNIRKAHPGDLFFWGALFSQWERIPRKTDFNRLRVIHAYDPERSEQSRGKPLLTSVLPQFKTLDRYTKAELDAALFNAVIAGTITTAMDQDRILDLFKNDKDAYLKARNESAVTLEGGMLVPLFPGDKLDPFIPQRPAAAFGMFIENVYRIIGVALDMPYELLLKDFSKTNYSSARAALLEAWRSFLRRRDWLGTQWLDPIYGLFAEEVINAGLIEAPNFYAKRSAYLRCKWIGPGRGWVDEVKEAAAAAMRIDSNISTLEEECARQGLYWRDVMDQRKVEYDYAKKLGLPQLAPTTVRISSTETPQETPAGPGPPGNAGMLTETLEIRSGRPAPDDDAGAIAAAPANRPSGGGTPGVATV